MHLLVSVLGIAVAWVLIWLGHRYVPAPRWWRDHERGLGVALMVALAAVSWAIAAGLVLAPDYLRSASRHDALVGAALFFVGGCGVAFFVVAALVSRPDRHSEAGRHSR